MPANSHAHVDGRFPRTLSRGIYSQVNPTPSHLTFNQLQVSVNTSVRTYIDPDISIHLPDRYVVERWELSGPRDSFGSARREDVDKQERDARCVSIPPLHEITAESTASDDISLDNSPSIGKDKL